MIRAAVILTFLSISAIAIAQGLVPNKAPANAADTLRADTLRFFKGTFREIKKAALKENKPFIVVCGASWCAPCHRLHNEILKYPYIANYLNTHFLSLYVDMDSFEGLELNNKFKVSGLPTVKFFDAAGKEKETINGYFDKAYFMKKLRIHTGKISGK